jgi:tRNA (cmo5U34)-methyltransferase
MQQSPKDHIFNTKKKFISNFSFNDEVAEVFDDMVSRSVPFYAEIHKIILDLVDSYYCPGDQIYDLGCSTGTTISILSRHIQNKFKKGAPSIFGVDNSPQMLKKCQEKLQSHLIENVELICEDINETVFLPSKIFIMNYTLQFLPPEEREKLIHRIYQSLKPGGIFILSEKIISENDEIDALLVKLYYDFKRRNGYSELEISQKREALENVMTPVTVNDQLSMLKSAGFKKTDVLFRWYNFACYFAIK